MMGRATLLAFLVAILACRAADSDIEGTWRGQSPSTVQNVMTLSESDGAVSGTGTYFISGPRPTGTFQVHGTFSDPVVTLLLEYDSGTRVTFNGRLETPSRLGGTVTFTTRSGEVRSDAVTFFKESQ